MGIVTFTVKTEVWPRAVPLRITGYTHKSVNVIVVTLEREGVSGRGEGAGVYYHGETVDTMMASLEGIRREVESGIDRDELQEILPKGGARNALDCAMWDLDAKLTGKTVWELAGLASPRPFRTTFTCSAESPSVMAAAARKFTEARAIKLKLTGDEIDADRVRAVRAALPDVWLCVDANQGFTKASFDELMPVLEEARVSLVEQPFPIGKERWLDDNTYSIPICADESAQDRRDIANIVGRFQMANIKLDKCGGFTEGLAMARALKAQGMGVMVGSMGGTSLAMGPIFLVGQLSDVADLDGPALLQEDRSNGVTYRDGCIMWSRDIWGHPTH